MRFRVPNNGGQQAADGIGNFFRSLAMAPMAEAQAAQSAQEAEQKRALMGAQTGLANASIGRTMAEAAIKEQEAKQLAVRPDMIKLMSASKAGVSVPDLNNAISERTHGAPEMGPAFLSAPIEGVGPSGRTAQFDDVISNLFAPAMAQGQAHTNFDQLSKARGEYQDQGIRGRAVEAATSGNHELAGALASVLGNKAYEPFAAVGNTGTAINKVTGAQPVVNPALNFLFDKEGRALIGQRDASAKASNASAASSYASAGQHRAATDKLRQDMAMGEKGTLQQTDQGLALVNPRTGTATLVNGPDGKPFSKAGGGAGGMKMTEGQAKANLFGQRMVGSNQILDDLAARGVSMPSQIKRGADAVPLIGTGLGMIANKIAASPEQQQVEQAQRDFVNAVLRRESGAVISDGEFANAAQQYFPQPGDAPAVIEQKRRNRQRATELMLMEVPDAVRARSAAPQEPAPVQPQGGSGYTGSWGAPSGQPRNVTVEY